MTNVVNPILSVIYHSVGTTKPPPPVSYPDPFPTTMTQSLTNPDSSTPHLNRLLEWPLTPSLTPIDPNGRAHPDHTCQVPSAAQGLPAKLGIPVKGTETSIIGSEITKTQAWSHRRLRPVIQSNSDPEIAVMDLAQDSDNNNSKSKPTGKKTRGVAVTEFDDVVLYFKAPTRAVGSTKGKKLWYKCRWCEKTYKRGEHTRSNLRVHRDGGVGQSACPGRNKAIETGGANLPKTWKDTHQSQGNELNRFLKTVPFDNRVLNQLLVMWLIRSALPWKRLEDALLHISFGYARRGVKLFSRTWAATEAHRLYLNLKQKVMDNLYAINSKISLIHDVWTTKGNRHTFLGISVAYISDDWVFCVSHLALKYISYTHKARPPIGLKQPNNDSRGGRLVRKKGITNLNLIKITFDVFVISWLDSDCRPPQIDLEMAGLIPDKHATLGFVPGLDTITEEAPESSVRPSNTFHSNDEAPAEINEAQLNEDDQELSENEEAHGEQPNRANSIATILKNVDYVIQQ
ncbi:hypothetical protein PSTT_11875 [Puccinia striiformis]|uniref:BED-type domain-containing protein n=1 Tax=Puccinia striiformis TaxID=27350 RepID=A0A2S4UYH6_9BASI|nr:hypothetical protein PSTT_11875 [Puccinia striiformis]